MKLEVKKNLIDAITAEHSKAEAMSDNTREQVEALIAQRQKTAALVETLQRKYKHTICLELAGVMNSQDVKRYETLHRIRSRDALVDKRQLSLIGLIDAGVAPSEGSGSAPSIAPVKTVSTIMTRAGRDFSKKLKDRPVEDWSPEEREQYKRSMLVFIEIYNQIK